MFYFIFQLLKEKNILQKKCDFKIKKVRFLKKIMKTDFKPIVGLEPTTYALRMRCSTRLAKSAYLLTEQKRESTTRLNSAIFKTKI